MKRKPKRNIKPVDLHALFCANVRYCRLHRKLTQEDLAERLNVVRAYVADIERGRNSPTLALVSRFATALEVDPRILFQKLS